MRTAPEVAPSLVCLTLPGPDDPQRGSDSTSEDRKATYAEKMKAARASAIGLQFGISIAIGALGGNWLDKRFDTEPWLLLTGIILGAAAAFRDLARLAREQEED